MLDMTNDHDSTTPDRNHRAVVHAGPLVLNRHNGTTRLERYLEAAGEREVFLIHRGQPELREAAREAGVSDIRVEPPDPVSEADAAADMAIALGAEQLEFAIDAPALQSRDGQFLEEITLREAMNFARRPSVDPEIRRKVNASCIALQRGLERVRIGSPTALLRDRATVIWPDPPFVLGYALVPEIDDTSSESKKPDDDPAVNEIRLPPLDRRVPRRMPLVARPMRRARGLRFSPRRGCEIGPPRIDPFPDTPSPFGRPWSETARRRQHVARLV